MRFLKSEAGAIILWLAASLFAAALLMPYLYDAGKTLAHNAETAEYPSVLEGVAASAGRAKPDRFFSRALLISALALLPALIRRVKKIPARDGADNYKLRKLSWPQRLTQLSVGMLTGAMCLGILATALALTDAASPKDAALSIGKFFSKAFLPALGAGVIEELVFRGLLLGLWLRACSLRSACIGSALMFAFMHFLSPPDGIIIADPRAWHAGFQILGSTLGHFTNPAFFVTEFATLTLLGLLLAYCRVRTFSLWLPIGIHAGLVFALKTFSMTMTLDPESPLNPWFIGGDLKSGILPLAALGICFAACIGITRFLPETKRPSAG
ncbi:CPBP family intramembrane metalloprotease [Akkermansiaceae bacterium]|nr:CPBP family intramembrane metalloprotease [Akkermansiaceae bacterium]